MPLYTKCLKCGGWKQAPEKPPVRGTFPTGPMLNVLQPPRNLCSCADDPPADTA